MNKITKISKDCFFKKKKIDGWSELFYMSTLCRVIANNTNLYEIATREIRSLEGENRKSNTMVIDIFL